MVTKGSHTETGKTQGQIHKEKLTKERREDSKNTLDRIKAQTNRARTQNDLTRDKGNTEAK